ncbi:hypothetical protein SAMN05216325_108124 [Nitrosomonas marina]|uniref:Uncharacterized protein n=1 Tax=Nitrosomonas marina TaxID=917 RepID=A0A1H8E4P1_9PROT|nr:hypothetical protein SAMN05216325_108124 [Nitrosomonas marina]
MRVLKNRHMFYSVGSNGTLGDERYKALMDIHPVIDYSQSGRINLSYCSAF